MTRPTLLIANRGEVAVRIARAAADVGLRSCAVHSDDDAESLHVVRADEAVALGGRGAAAYRDPERLLAAAARVGATMLHPGYGFLSESPDLARRCAAAGVTFVGPSPDTLALLGDKPAARALAVQHGVPVAAGTAAPAGEADAAALLRSLGPGGAVMLKAAHAGGGRGLRLVADAAALPEAMARCRSEALAMTGRDDVYAEAAVAPARHIEVQVIGDGSGAVSHLWERDCSLQRRHQKLVEMAPAPGLDEELRHRLLDAAVRMAAALRYASLGTFEFLVALDAAREPRFVFIEANPRLQVEHPVTEAVTGVDLVVAQLRLAMGETLAGLHLEQRHIAPPRGAAVEVRVSLEVLQPDGEVRPAVGVVTAFEPPTGPGVRVDTAACAGYRPHPGYDSLLAKVVGHAPDLASALRRTERALAEMRVDGADTNVDVLRHLLRRPEVADGSAGTRFVEEHVAELVVPLPREPRPAAVGAVDASGAARSVDGPPGSVATESPVQGTVVAVTVAEGDAVAADTVVVVVEAMKMEHAIRAGTAGTVRVVAAAPGDTVLPGEPLLFVEEEDVAVTAGAAEEEAADALRADLDEVLRRQGLTRDAARPDVVERRHGQGRRTARENVADLCDPDSFVEYGSLVIAAQRARRSVDELVRRTPADGLVAGVGRVNGELFGDDRSHCAVLSYDYTVLAGTQGQQNHRKKDRLFELVERQRLPVVLFAEGGGGRPGDTDTATVSGLDCMAFALFAGLSGLVPTVGIVSGRCFAGNAALLGCCDVIIATEDANIGMGGPAMVEGGGLGVYSPEEIGPVSVQAPNGVVDVVTRDDAEAVATARRYLSYFQGPLATWECADQRLLRRLVPENRKRVYDVRRVITTMADTGSVLELRARFGVGMVTALARIEGRPLGIVANNPLHLGGAIDSDAADKAARFLQLCDAFGLPVLFLCDTPGFMVGPQAERSAQVRHFSRMFVGGAALQVPFFTIVLRKGYGLGAQAMAGGSFKAPLFTVGWPTGEFGAMGLEGAVRLGFRRELDAIDDPERRREEFERMVAMAYEHGRALNVATYFEIDDVIDPADSRRRVVHALRSSPPPPPPGRHPVDAW